MPSMQKIGQHCTTVSTDGDGTTRVTYHETDVVTFNADKIVLDTGGWQTVTTKTRMNQASNEFGLGYQVYQNNNEWYVMYAGEVYPFKEEVLTLERK